MIKRNFFIILALCGIALAGTSCNKQQNNNAKFQSAIDSYYQAHPDCLWPQAKKLPAQAVTSDDSETQGYDALTDAGLLTRTTAEKKKFIIASQQVNNYDLSGTGRSDWTPDPSQPGYGNFCYGHRKVAAIDNSTLTKTSSGARSAVVNYHYNIQDAAPWANTQEMKTAFPSLGDALAGPQSAQMTLSSNDGKSWQVASPSS